MEDLRPLPDLQARSAQALFWVALSLVVPALVVSDFGNRRWSEAFLTAALAIMLTAAALSRFRWRVSLPVSAAGVAVVIAVFDVLSLPHWVRLVLGVLLSAAWIWMYVARPMFARLSH